MNNSKGKDKLVKKKNSLRYNEYYDMQKVFDELYDKSIKGYSFKRLMSIINSENNILLAYRQIKSNKGSITAGTDFKIITNLAEMETDKFVKMIQDKLKNYNPQPIRRVEIEKENGKTRPLGIPTITDRIIQQAIKQVVEPIAEAKFHPHSYGFRPNRSTHHAIARAVSLVNMNGLNYVVDVDIKSFFDNVNHGKLLKQMWNLGIKDKQLISVISKMLKAEVKGIGKPDKGTPQGGILSPLLSNIVLNELDWWVSSQWEDFKPSNIKAWVNKKKGKPDKSYTYQALKKTDLKEMFIVRYADDFKIFCRSYNEAQKMFVAVKKWLKDRLGLEISPEKSKITNLRKQSTEFLGFKLKAEYNPKARFNYSAKTSVSERKIQKIKVKTRKLLKDMRHNQEFETINRYNMYMLGIHNYTQIATQVAKNFFEVWYDCMRTYIRTGKKCGKRGSVFVVYRQLIEKFYKDYMTAHHIYTINGITLIPPYGVKHRNPINFTQEINDFTEVGRLKRHKYLSPGMIKGVKYLTENKSKHESVEYNDLKISVYLAQQGKCKITDEFYHPSLLELHHKKPRHMKGKDMYNNLVYLHKDIHKLIHLKDHQKIMELINKFNLTNKQVQEVNKYRIKANMPEIEISKQVA